MQRKRPPNFWGAEKQNLLALCGVLLAFILSMNILEQHDVKQNKILFTFTVTNPTMSPLIGVFVHLPRAAIPPRYD